jgi:protein translocase SecG subunit
MLFIVNRTASLRKMTFSDIVDTVSPMSATLHSLQLVTAIVLIALVLLQRTSGDTASNFGDSMSFLQTRRGVDRFLFVLTIIVAVVFVTVSIWVIARA